MTSDALSNYNPSWEIIALLPLKGGIKIVTGCSGSPPLATLGSGSVTRYPPKDSLGHPHGDTNVVYVIELSLKYG